MTRTNTYRCGLLFRLASFWIGVHYSSFDRRFCINLLPFVTFWIALPGGHVPKPVNAPPEQVREPNPYWLESWSASERDRLVAIWTEGIDLTEPDDKPVYIPQWKVVMALMQNELDRLRDRTAERIGHE